MTRFHVATLAVLIGSLSLPPDSRAQESNEPGASIAALARASEGRKFGRGECWDFAAALLDRTDSDWERPRQFGEVVDTRTEKLAPGDILQFESVKLSWKRQNRSGTIFLGFPSHTAIVLAANGSLVEIAHQNYNRVRHVTRLTIDLSDITEGTWSAYRPVRAAGR